MKDYDFQLMYYPGKANVVAYALSRKSTQVSAMMIEEEKLIEQFRNLNWGVQFHVNHISCSIYQIKDFVMGEDEILRFKGRVCISTNEELKRMILEESYKGYISLRPSMNKMYQNLKESFWWSGMRKEIA